MHSELALPGLEPFRCQWRVEEVKRWRCNEMRWLSRNTSCLDRLSLPLFRSSPLPLTLGPVGNYFCPHLICCFVATCIHRLALYLCTSMQLCTISTQCCTTNPLLSETHSRPVLAMAQGWPFARPGLCLGHSQLRSTDSADCPAPHSTPLDLDVLMDWVM